MLKVGDPAPPLAVGAWIKGEPIAAIEKGRVYVLEFWATWCAPCVAAMPHLTELQKRFPEMVFIGVDVLEGPEAEPAVRALLAKKGDEVGYRIATDKFESANERAGVMAQTWLLGSGNNGIPCSMVVDAESRIAWIGHPASGLESVLERIKAGTFDAMKEIAEQEAAAKRAAEIGARIEQAADRGDWDAALAAIDELAEAQPGYKPILPLLKVRFLLRPAGNPDLAHRMARSLLEGEYKDNPDRLAELASLVLNAPDVEKRDHQLALKLAERASALKEPAEAGFLALLARSQFEAGRIDDAVRTQEQVIRMIQDPREQLDQEDTLLAYRREQEKTRRK